MSGNTCPRPSISQILLVCKTVFLDDLRVYVSREASGSEKRWKKVRTRGRLESVSTIVVYPFCDIKLNSDIFDLLT